MIFRGKISLSFSPFAMKITRALLSVSDKTGIVDFAEFLHTKGIEMISTGGTAKAIREKNIPVRDISEITNFPEMLDGRVKTLHPKIHGGLLFVRGNDAHEKIIAEHEIGAIDLVVVNLYPFEKTVAGGAGEEECIENIDIGGPSMLRSAAKNFAAVTVVIDPTDLESVKNEMTEIGGTKFETRKKLAGKVFAATAKYDAAIARFFDADFSAFFPQKKAELRYGENPHQKAILFENEKTKGASIATAHQIQGKELGYCNILDADAALKLALEFGEPVAVIVKHATPCGVALAENAFDAYTKALSADPVSAFGGIVAVNREIDETLAKKMSEHFLEVIIAPKFSEAAKKVFSEKENLRVLEIADWSMPKGEMEIRSVLGGLLQQNQDDKILEKSDLEYAVGSFDENQLSDALFAGKVVKHVKSNAIVIVKNGVTIGIGGGQTSRVRSSEIAVKSAGESAKGAIAASDAFFPFPDGVEFLANAGVMGIVQPGGSKKDMDIFATAKKLGITMALTGTRAFRH